MIAGWPTFDQLTMSRHGAWAGMLVWMFVAGSACGQEPPAAVDQQDAARRAAAVTLNYSRASFHRIRRNPTLRVLTEEQEKILNHLNLNGVADEDVLKLYSSVLDEIAQIQLADRERELLRGKHRQQFQSQLGFSALALGMQMATAQYASAVRTGAASWWDFRNFSTNRDLDLHKIDRERMTKLVEKSTKFLDVSWKMARTRQIPDRWLVRGDDLDQLERAWQEPDLTTRLRVLKRMEPFMECYPPYWYYVARTQQQLGQLTTASDTFGQLATVGQGHFRKDEMLAAGLANRAIIQAYLGDPGASATARQALAASSEVWEANLLCANVLQRERHYDDAEDAILRNLDVDLETSQSRVALVGLYLASDDRAKLSAQLADLSVVPQLPVPLLMACAHRLGETNAPPLLAQVLEKSLQAQPRINLGRDDLIIQATSNWQLERAQIRLAWKDGVFVHPRLTTQGDSTIATFEGIGELASFGGRLDVRQVELAIQYPDASPIKLTLNLGPDDSLSGENGTLLTTTARRGSVYQIVSYEQDQQRLAVAGGHLKCFGSKSTTIAQPDATPDRPTATPVGITTFRPAPTGETVLTTPTIEVSPPATAP